MQTLSKLLPFHEAFEIWIQSRLLNHPTLTTNARYISERTEWDYRQYARSLGRFFYGMPLCEIKLQHVNAYHQVRAYASDGYFEHQAGANRIRKEVGLLVRMLTDSGAWTTQYKGKFIPVQRVENDVQRAMDPYEQERFLQVAASADRWALIYHYSIAALQTTAATNEMRTLRLGDVNLDQGIVKVRNEGAKNKYRVRSIPLETTEALKAFSWLMWRAQEMGAGLPQHYLFPVREKRGVYDPTQAMSESGLRKPWDEVRKAAGLGWLRPYDLRHTAITRYAEAGTPMQVIESMAGHIGAQMQRHYTTISQVAQRRAIAQTWTAKLPERKPPVRATFGGEQRAMRML